MPAANQSPRVTAIRQWVRQFLLDENVVEEAETWDRTDRVPAQLIAKLAERGLCGLVVPEELGGQGRDVFGYMAVVEELAKASFGLSATYAMNAGYGGLAIGLLGSEAQKIELMPGILAGRLFFAYGLSEPAVGADLANVQTRVVRNGDTLVVTGAKRWTSGGAEADYIHVLARSGAPEERHRNLTMVLVPTDAPGVTVTKMDIMGSGGNCPCDVVLADVEVPAENILGGQDEWNKGWAALVGPTLEIEKIQPAAMALGNAEAAVAEAWDYSQERVQFGHPICSFQAVRHALADARTALQACRTLLAEATRLVEEREPSAVITSMAKLFVSETTRDVVLSCQQIMGAPGYARGRAMERLVRDSLLFSIIGGSSAIQRNNIANLLKLPKG